MITNVETPNKETLTAWYYILYYLHTMHNNTAVRAFSLHFGATALTNKALVLGYAKFGMETGDNYTYTLQQDMEVNNRTHDDDAKLLS